MFGLKVNKKGRMMMPMREHLRYGFYCWEFIEDRYRFRKR